MSKKKKQKVISQKLLRKYSLVIQNVDTYEKLLAFNLTRLNVFIFLGISSILLVGFTILFIAFTPLREYIPGYSSTALKKQALELNFKTDSLQQIIIDNDKYYGSIKKVLQGEVSAVQINKDSILEAAKIEIDDVDLNPTKQDSILRAKVDKEDKTADGTVIFSEWTVETGFVAIIEHSHGLISVYKHNSSLTKSQGDLVKSGEVIAMAGSTGELSTGPHLHFELWSDGYPIDPAKLIDFKK